MKIGPVRGFEWDGGNRGKNEAKHGVADRECEEVLHDRKVVVAPARPGLTSEPRYAALGETLAGRRLTVVFTLRHDRIRVISGRPMSRRERIIYEEAEQS